jgi:hypothetical protein
MKILKRKNINLKKLEKHIDYVKVQRIVFFIEKGSEKYVLLQ